MVDYCTVYAIDRRGRGASGDADEDGLENVFQLNQNVKPVKQITNELYDISNCTAVRQ